MAHGSCLLQKRPGARTALPETAGTADAPGTNYEDQGERAVSDDETAKQAEVVADDGSGCQTRAEVAPDVVRRYGSRQNRDTANSRAAVSGRRQRVRVLKASTSALPTAHDGRSGSRRGLVIPQVRPRIASQGLWRGASAMLRTCWSGYQKTYSAGARTHGVWLAGEPRWPDQNHPRLTFLHRGRRASPVAVGWCRVVRAGVHRGMLWLRHRIRRVAGSGGANKNSAAKAKVKSVSHDNAFWRTMDVLGLIVGVAVFAGVALLVTAVLAADFGGSDCEDQNADIIQQNQQIGTLRRSDRRPVLG